MSIPPAAAFLPLTDAEFEAILARAKADPSVTDLADILTILFHTGMRPVELARLEWKHVRFDSMQLVVMSARGQTRRGVPFSHKVLRVLQARKEEALDSKYILGSAPFRTLEKACRRLFDIQSESGSRLIGLYLLRRTFFFRWTSSGGDLEELSLITGSSLPARCRKRKLTTAKLLISAALFQTRLEDDE
jgi:integrase